ncbi:antitoxin, partial [Cutibacterium acnes]
QIAREALIDYAKDGHHSRPISKLWDECNL